MKLDHTLHTQWSPSGDRLATTIPGSWGQGRTTYGGLMGAHALSIAKRADPERAIRSFSSQLVRPIRPGPVEATLQVVRRGKNTTFVEVELHQDSMASRFQVVLGSPRPASLAVPAAESFHVPNPDELVELPYVEGMMPEFLQHFDLRWSEGSVPYSGTQASFAGVCRYRGEAGGAEGLAALLDAWPCPSLAALRKPASASTATWSAQLFHQPPQLDGWCSFRYRTEHGADGFHAVRGALFDASGAMLAMTEQLVILFDSSS